MKKRKRNEGERTNKVQHAYRSKHNNFINQLIQLPLNALSTIYIKTLVLVVTEFLLAIGILWACLVHYNGNYIGIGISITKNKKSCNGIIITIHLFGDTKIKTLK